MKFCAALFLLTAATLTAVDYTVEGNLWWAHIQYLADDKLEGRNTGSEGYKQAVKYVAGQFESFGLKPGGVSGYEQPVKFETRTLAAADSSLALIRDGKTETLQTGQANADATLSGSSDGGSVTAPMVFVGYGLQIPEANVDNFAGVDLHGKVAVYINAPGPITVSPNVLSNVNTAAQRWAMLRKAGAIGIATIANPRPANGAAAGASGGAGRAGGAGAGVGRAGAAGGSGGRGGGGGGQGAMSLADPDLRESLGQKVSIALTRTGGEKVFAGSGHTYDSIIKAAAANEPLSAFPLTGTLQAKTTITTSGQTEASNVVGILPGSDPKLKDEYVIFSAHLDHLGIGRAVNGDTIYNGAMDNASGVASVLEVARLFKQTGLRPKRSIIFLTVTAEEKGELGSRYFSFHPTVPFDKIVADINLDMYLPLYGLKVLEVQGLAESTLGDQIWVAAADSGIRVQTDREPDQNRFIRSDQYSFIKRGIPSLAFKFGYEFGSPDEKTRTDWVKNIYHKPGDDLNQPVDKASAARFDRIIFDLLQRIANNPERPRWRSDSFFSRFASATDGGK